MTESVSLESVDFDLSQPPSYIPPAGHIGVPCSSTIHILHLYGLATRSTTRTGSSGWRRASRLSNRWFVAVENKRLLNLMSLLCIISPKILGDRLRSLRYVILCLLEYVVKILWISETQTNVVAEKVARSIWGFLCSNYMWSWSIEIGVWGRRYRLEDSRRWAGILESKDAKESMRRLKTVCLHGRRINTEHVSHSSTILISFFFYKTTKIRDNNKYYFLFI